MSAPQQSFRFGVEIEFLLASVKFPNCSRASLFNEVKERLSEAGISSKIFLSTDRSEGRYEAWSITTEVTVQGAPDEQFYGVELVSPVYTIDCPWAQDLHTIFSVLKTHFNMGPSDKCGTHVHISRTTPFSAAELANLAKTTLYFESALDSLMPATRKNDKSYWSQSNRNVNNPALVGLTLNECLAKIDKAASSSFRGDGAEDHLRPIIEVMNLCSHETKLAKIRGKTAPFIRGKTYKWDFTGLLVPSNFDVSDPDLGVKDTIEFRQPPCSRAAEEAEAWVKLTVAFVAGAVEGGHKPGKEEGASVQELRELVERGAERLGWLDLKVLHGLFQRAA